MIAERFSWPAAETYELDLFADDSANEKRLKRAQKEAKKAREERVRLRKVKTPRRNFRYSNRIYQPTNAFTVDPRSSSFCYCKGYGLYARFCRDTISSSPVERKGAHRLGLYGEKPVQP